MTVGRGGPGRCFGRWPVWPFRTIVLVLVVIALARSVSAQRAEPTVDLNLVLAIDCSYSVDSTEFGLQLQGLANAFRTPEVLEAIGAGPHGAISVAVVQWSSQESQIVAVPWRLVNDAASASALANEISGLSRLTAEGATSISTLITFSIDLIAASPVKARRNVIDVSADGANNNGIRVDLARDFAIAQGIVVNGLTILNEVRHLHYYFRNHVVGGTGAFVEIADDYADFERAIRKKLLREIRANYVS